MINSNDESCSKPTPHCGRPRLEFCTRCTMHCQQRVTLFHPFLNWPSVNKSLGNEKRVTFSSFKYIYLYSPIQLSARSSSFYRHFPILDPFKNFTTYLPSSFFQYIPESSYSSHHGHQINGSRPLKAQPIPNPRRILNPLVHKTRTSHCPLLPRPRGSTL
jgi:hypothetical protein